MQLGHMSVCFQKKKCIDVVTISKVNTILQVQLYPTTSTTAVPKSLKSGSGAPQRGHVPVWTTLIQEPKDENWSKEVFDWDKLDVV